MSKLIKALGIICLLCLALSSSAFAKDYVIDTSQSDIKIHVGIVGISDIIIDVPKFEGQFYYDPEELEKSSATLKIFAKDLDGGSDFINERLASEFLFESDRHPYIFFKSMDIQILTPEHIKLKGHITVKNIQKYAVIDVHLREKHHPPKFYGFLAIQKSDFDMHYGAPIIDDTVEIKFIISGK
ncbi:MAG: YceI family protein [Pseudomonadota bacterium]